MKNIIRVTFVFSLVCASATYAASFNKHNMLRISDIKSKPTNIDIVPKSVIHLNTAIANSLMRLKGIGKKHAKDIIAYRNLHGPFKKIDDLALVPGFNKKFVDRLIKKNDRIRILI